MRSLSGSGGGSSFEDVDFSLGDAASAPPVVAAVGAVLLGATSIVLAFAFHGRAGFIGWILGFGGIVAGIIYRTVSRSRQLNWNFSSDRRIDRAMLVGVLLGFVGVAMNAYVIAQITVQ